MLVSVRSLHRCQAATQDGNIGPVADTYFEFPSLAVRYLVVNARELPASRKVLIATDAVEAVDAAGERVRLALSTNQVRESPEVDAALPLERALEHELRRYYRWIPYWQEIGAPVPQDVDVPKKPPSPAEQAPDVATPLRSAAAILGAGAWIPSGVAGELSDLLLETEGWRLAYFDIALTGEDADADNPHALIPAARAESMNWLDKTVRLAVPKHVLGKAPKHQAGAAPSAEQARAVDAHFTSAAD